MSSDDQSNQPAQDQPNPAPAAAPAAPPAPAPAPVEDASGDAAPAAIAMSAAAAASAEELLAPKALHHHLHRAKALSERLLGVMAQREERLAEIKRRVGLLEPSGEGLQPLMEAEANMRDAHTRMKAVLTDLGKELQIAGVNELVGEPQLTDLPNHTGQGDEVAFLYKHLLLALGEWKAAQQRLATERAETLAKQVQNLREQVGREHAETARIRRRKEELERLKLEKQGELDAIRKEKEQPQEPKE